LTCVASFKSFRDIARQLSLAMFVIYACSNPTPETRVRGEGNEVRSVFIVHDAWHAAIVIKKANITAVVLPELRDFPTSEYLEFSWGDRDYFPAPDAGFEMALKAAFWSRGSILHVVGFTKSVEAAYPGAEIVEIPLSEEGFQRLVRFISDTFSRPNPPTPAEARPGLFASGRFYAAEGKFSFLRTCNTWVAEALSAAGLPINPGYVITAGNLSNQVRGFAAGK